jgi:elongation factor P hydroxylase
MSSGAAKGRTKCWASAYCAISSDFYAQYQTRLVKGEGEPVYLPGDQHQPDHQIIFAHGFFASALHEISHWLVAGCKRRQQEDFGYWYHPDGRNAEQQADFEAVEVKPQAIEWMLSVAAGFAFNVSCDNLDGETPDRQAFQYLLHRQVEHLLNFGCNRRTEQLISILAAFYHTPLPLTFERFSFEGFEPLRLVS